MTILHIDSSVLGENSASRQVTAAISAALSAETGAEVIYRDLADPESAWPAGKDAVDVLLSADTIVVGAPMYNFGVPHQLKAWIDSIAVARRTFAYTETGPVGLAGGRRLIVVYASGGFHADDDFVEPYLRQVFGFLGITDVTVIRVEGTALPDVRAKAIAAALGQVPALVAETVRLSEAA